MFNFCPHCGQSIEQEQVQEQLLTCIHCQQPIGIVGELEAAPAEEPAQDVQTPGKSKDSRDSFGRDPQS